MDIRKYAMAGKRREALIINNINFKQTGYMPRDYSATDAAQLASKLEKLNFLIRPVMTNQTAKQMEDCANECK